MNLGLVFVKRGAIVPRVVLVLYGYVYNLVDFPGGSDGKESACNAEDHGSIPGLGRSPGEGSGNRPQYSCLENSTERGTWWATVHGSQESDMTE